MNMDTIMDFPYIKGMTYGYMSKKGDWANKEAFESFDIMADSLNINTVVLPVVAWQKNAQSTEIDYEGKTVSDWEITNMIDYAHKKGLRVVLKPMINLEDGTSRSYINFFDNDIPFEPSWDDWFKNYTKFILHMAEIANETCCSIFSVGCELVQSERRESQWRNLIKEVRNVYNGYITYNSGEYQEDKVEWWDAVDIISSCGYYAPEDIKSQLERIKRVVAAQGKPFMFLEAGCPSRAGASNCPNKGEIKAPVNIKEQADYYKKLFGVTKNLNWFYGFGLWNWPLHIYGKSGASYDDGYCVYGKEAQDVINIEYA